MYVEFNTLTSSAILQSPPYNITTPVCLAFNYNISSSKIYLRILASTSTTPEFQQVALLTFTDQDLTNIWSSAMVSLPNGLTGAQFVADKVGVTVGIVTAMIDDVTVFDGLCPVSGK